MSKLEIIKQELQSLQSVIKEEMKLKKIVEELLEYVIQLEAQCISLLQNRNQDKIQKPVQPELAWSTLRSDRLPLKIHLLNELS